MSDEIDVRKYRKKLNMSQKLLSLKTGVSKFRISQHECNYEMLKVEELESIKSYFDGVQLKNEMAGGENG